MRIVHFSDWHWNLRKLPAADLYVCTGDMLDDANLWASAATPNAVKVTASLLQEKLLDDHPGFRRFLGSPEAPVICVRGNHDYVDLGGLFSDCTFVHEFRDNETIDVHGLRVTGHRGVPYINGYFSDEPSRADLLDKVRTMPSSDLILTHYAPAGVGLDGARGGAHYGLEHMLNHLVYTTPPTASGRPSRVHFFGHIHACGGRTAEAGGVLFSNAATDVNVIDGDPISGWRA